jgi:hypothetical protein
VRVSVNDPGFFDIGAPRYRALLDGVEVKKVTMADEEAGVVERLVCDENGNVMVDPISPDMAWREVLHGKVEIVQVGASEGFRESKPLEMVWGF